MAEDDSQLLEKVRAGDTDSFRALLERHGPTVWRSIDGDIGAHWRSKVDADDVMQVTYLEAFLHMDRVSAQDERSFVAWLRKAAQNNLRDAVKELGRQKRPPPAKQVQGGPNHDSYAGLVDFLGAHSETPSRQVARGEAADAIRAVLERMPDDYSRVVQLYDIEGRSIADVSREMSRSTGAVHMLRARAHDCLRKMLGAETDFFSNPS